MRPFLSEISSELAKPFIEAYAEKWDLPVSDDGFDLVKWYGAWYKETLRGVFGLTALPELNNSLFVYGIYGDGSLEEVRSIMTMFDFLDHLPIPLWGTVHMPNERMLAAATKRGWFINNENVDLCAYVIRKPAVV